MSGVQDLSAGLAQQVSTECWGQTAQRVMFSASSQLLCNAHVLLPETYVSPA